MNNMPAFPQHGWTSDPETLRRMEERSGMSLRDYFAAKAMQGLLSGTDGTGCTQICAEQAYAYADAMLKVREETP